MSKKRAPIGYAKVDRVELKELCKRVKSCTLKISSDPDHRADAPAFNAGASRNIDGERNARCRPATGSSSHVCRFNASHIIMCLTVGLLRLRVPKVHNIWILRINRKEVSHVLFASPIKLVQVVESDTC